MIGLLIMDIVAAVLCIAVVAVLYAKLMGDNE